MVIKNVRVFDGSRFLLAQTVVISDGQISEMGASVSMPEEAMIVDGTGKTLLPGFIDSHAHVWSIDHLEQSAIFGATTVLDMGCGDPKIGSELRKRASEPGSAIADLRFAGYAVTAPNAHCTEYGFPVPTITQPAEAVAFIDARISEGSDYIKLVYDDARALGLTAPTISKELLKAAIDATHARGKLALVHIGSMQGAREAIEAGADGLAHTFIDRSPDSDFGQLLASHHAFVIPTLSVNKSLATKGAGTELTVDADLAPYLSLDSAAGLKKSFATFPNAHISYSVANETIPLLVRAKVPVLAGTDAPNAGTTYGATVHRELELLVAAGLTPQEALAAATSMPAAQFRLADRGRIAKGLRADLVLIDGDPATDIKATRRISAVWRAGVQVDRKAYLAKLEAEKAEAVKKVEAPAPAGSEGGLVSDFDDLTIKAQFGVWAESTDAIRGGKSTVIFKATKGGTNKTKGALSVKGDVAAGLAFAWSGVIFMPGDRPMGPANLSAKKQLVFSVKGQLATLQVLMFAENRGYMPVPQTVSVTPEWKEHRFSLSDFDGLDGHDLMGIAFVSGPKPGPFSFQLDSVRFE